MLAPLYTAVLLAQSAVGGLFHPAPRTVCCDVCGVEKAVIATEIARLQTCPFWKDRDRAARALRHHAWECHPEIVVALANALLRDCHEEVREEAAESLTKLAPCMTLAHQALAVAWQADPDHATRHWAKRGLAKLSRRCDAQCVVCSRVTVPVPVPQVPVGEPILAPIESPIPPSPVPPETGLRFDDPPRDLPGTVPGASPFSSASSAGTKRPPGQPGAIVRRTNLASLLLGRPDREGRIRDRGRADH